MPVAALVLCLSLVQCTTMPACDKVNARKAPIAYSEISRSRDAAEHDQDDDRESGQRVDAVREQQPPPAQREDVRQVVVDGDGARQPRESGEGRVRAEGQRQEHRPHGEVIDPAAAEDCHHNQAQQALVAVSALGSIAMMWYFVRQPGGAVEQHDQRAR